MTHHAGKTEQLTKAKKSLLQGGGQGGWGSDQPAPSPPHHASETRALSPPCKGGPGGDGGRINQLRRHRTTQAKPAHFPPLAKGGPGGVGAGSTSSVAAAMRKDVITFPPLQRGGQGGGGRINQLRRHLIAQAKPAHFPPLAKGGPGGVGAGSTSSVATAMRKRNPRTFPPLQRGGQGGWGPDQPAPSAR